jgi:transcription elongation factor Elf1
LRNTSRIHNTGENIYIDRDNINTDIDIYYSFFDWNRNGNYENDENDENDEEDDDDEDEL